MYSYMRHQVDSPFDTVVHGELWAYSLDAFRAEAEDLDLTEVYGYFARAAKSMVAWKHAKGGTRRTAP